MIRFFRALPALVFLIAASSYKAASAQRGTVSPGPQAQPSRRLPNVQIKTPDAKGINLSKYRGKEIIIVLFSTECEDCLRTIAIVDKIQKDYGPRGLQVIGAAVNEGAPYSVAGWVQRYRPTFPIGFLDTPGLIKLAAVPKDTRPFVPIIMFVDSTGTVRVQYYGDSPVFKEQQEKAIRAIAGSLLNFQAQQAAKAKAAAKAAEAAKSEVPPAKPEPN
jgi:thiol-disulfide isomerase/thioredoxin